MSAELHRKSIDAFNRRDWDAFAGLMDEEIEAESRLVQIEGGYHGHEGLRRWWDDLLGTIPDYALEVDELREEGTMTLAHIRGAATNMPLIDPVWQPAQWRDGKCVWWRVCSTEAEALEAIRARRR